MADILFKTPEGGLHAMLHAPYGSQLLSKCNKKPDGLVADPETWCVRQKTFLKKFRREGGGGKKHEI